MKNNTIAHALCKILENESELSLNIPSLSFYGSINTDDLHVTDNGFVQGGDLSITDASAFSAEVLLSDEIEGTVLRLSLGEMSALICTTMSILPHCSIGFLLYVNAGLLRRVMDCMWL